jgi:hypothetical protein
MAVGTARRESKRASAKPPGLALNATKAPFLINDQVVACVLAEWDQNRDTEQLQRNHDRERALVSD